MSFTSLQKQAHRLYDLGFAIIWLHERSKRPVESGWTTGPRAKWSHLSKTYHKGLNVGVRLGSPSKIGENYLAVVDVDVKSKDEKHRKEAIAAARRLLGDADCPCVQSGRGNGSRHYYCVTEEPFKTWNPAQSKEIVKVHMPSKKPSKVELETLTKSEIAQGIRLAPAWEISLYSNGRQVVLPPSIHPDSGKEYKWTNLLASAESLPIVEFDHPPEETRTSTKGKNSVAKSTRALEGFTPEDVNIDWLPLKESVREGIINGTSVNDRSGYLLVATNALISAGLSRNEVLSVLSDPDTFLGACCYDHAKTTDRLTAVRWLWKYTCRDVFESRDPKAAFADYNVDEEEQLSPEKAKEQAEEIESEIDWRQRLEKDGKGKYKPTYLNCRMIIENVTGQKDLVGRNEFAGNDYYLHDSPWRSKKGDPIIDHDITRIKTFCAEKFGVEFNDNVIDQALLDVADINRFHPVREYLNGLEWDGVDRIDTWLRDYAGAVGPEPYLSDVSRKLLVAMVARIYRPGIKFDQLVILEGVQGTGKSTVLQKLASDAWFTDAPLNIGDKDSVMTMQSKWIIEVGELSSLNKAEIEVFKVFAAQRVDRIRLPYGKRTEEFPRQSVMIGTTNNDDYLRDLTGNRRFWSVKTTGQIDTAGLEHVRDQLFAEAVAYYNLGEPLWLENRESEEQSVVEQTKRMQSDEWMSSVREVVEEEGFPIDGFEMRDVAKRMDQFGAHKLSPSDVHRIGRCLKLLGYEKYQESTGYRRKLWRPGKALK